MSKIKSKLKCDIPPLVLHLSEFASNSYNSINDIHSHKSRVMAYEKDIPDDMSVALTRELVLTPKMYSIVSPTFADIGHVLLYHFNVDGVDSNIPDISCDTERCILYMCQRVDNDFFYGQLHFSSVSPELSKHLQAARLRSGSLTDYVRDVLNRVLKLEHEAAYDNAFEEND